MIKLFEAIRDRNAELGYEQEISKVPTPNRLLMIDGKTTRAVTPMVASLYEFATTWTQGFSGMSLVDPNALEATYNAEDVEQALSLTAENYQPLPPSDPSDWARTALLAREEFGLGLVLLWWEVEQTPEPAVISISGGNTKVFADLTEYAEYLAHGHFPERGEKIYTLLETKRGTLST